MPFFFPFSVLGQISTFLSLSTQYRSKLITHLISMIIFHSFHVSQNAGLTQITENHRLSFLEQTRRLQSYSSETKHILLLTNTHPHRIIQGLHTEDYRQTRYHFPRHLGRTWLASKTVISNYQAEEPSDLYPKNSEQSNMALPSIVSYYHKTVAVRTFPH